MSGHNHNQADPRETSEPWPGSAYERRWIEELDRHAREGCPVCKASRGEVSS